MLREWKLERHSLKAPYSIYITPLVRNVNKNMWYFIWIKGQVGFLELAQLNVQKARIRFRELISSVYQTDNESEGVMYWKIYVIIL